ncbi:hypothetical protein Tco_1208776 [Tanacetum coccineum]
MKTRVSTLSKDELVDLVKTFRIHANLHPRLPDPALTMDHLPDDAIDHRAIPDHLTWRHSHSCVSDDLPIDGYDQNDVEQLCARVIRLREMKEEVLLCSGLSSVWLNKKYDPVFRKKVEDADAKIVEELYHLPILLLDRVSKHTTAPSAEGVPVSLPTPDEGKARPTSIVVSEFNRPSKNKKLRKRAWEVGSSAPEVEQIEDLNDVSDFWVDLENSLERTGSIPARAVSSPTPHLGKRLGPPPSSSFVVVSEPLQIGGSVHASTSDCSVARKGSATGGFTGKPGVEDVQRCLDPLDTLARSALARDSEYDQIPEDDFATASRGEEIDLTLFPLALCPFWTSFPVFDGNFLLLTKGKLKPDRKTKYVKELRSEVTALDKKLEEAQGDCSVLAQENRELRAQNEASSEENELALERSKSQEYKDIAEGLRTEVTRFVGFGVECLVRRLLSSDEFHVALAHVVSLGIASSVENGLRMGCIDAEFEAAVRNVSNFSIGAEVKFNKALDAFPSIQFPFLSKVSSAAEGPFSEVTQIVPEKFVCSARSVFNVAIVVSEVPNQAPIDQASDD